MTNVFTVLVCGDRNWTDTRIVWSVLTSVLEQMRQHEQVHVIEGGQRGADRAARDWAVAHEQYGVTHQTYDADWRQFGRRAGPIRNRRMLLEGKPDLVIGFHAKIEESKGTRDMLDVAMQRGVETILLDGRNQDGERIRR